MAQPKYSLPTFLEGRLGLDGYRRWLDRKAASHFKRDKGRGNVQCTKESYKLAIHSAVRECGGKDYYTGNDLDWELAGTYDNEEAKAGKKAYWNQFKNSPSVDHVGSGLDQPEFKICGHQTNDCKSLLTYDELIAFCRDVLRHDASKESSPKTIRSL